MWWFPSCFKHDPSKDDITADEISRYEKEDRIVRQKNAKIELERAKEESLKQAKQDEKRRLEDSKEKGKKVDDDREDEQLAKSHMENFKDKEQIKHSKDDVKEDVNPPPSISNGCKFEIGDGTSVSQCLCCHLCDKPIAMDEIPKKGKYHRHCYKANRNCYVCKKTMPSTEKGIEYRAHPFWKEKYCPGHDADGTPKCCSCERLEPRGTNYVMLDDRWLCLQCIESSVMDTYECHSLHVEIRDFFEGLFLKIEKEFPLLLVEKQALNKAEEEEKIDYHGGAVTRGLCMYEEQIVRNIIKGPTLGPDKQLVDMVTETQRVGGCEVTGILIIYGLPRLLTGFLLAHEMMHAWLRLNGYRDLKLELEEGLCQALGLRWLESQTFVSTDAAAAVASSSRTPPAAITSKKSDEWSDFEKKYVEFCIYQIKEDETPVYGLGFKQVYQMLVSNDLNIKDTLKDIVTASKTIPDSK